MAGPSRALELLRFQLTTSGFHAKWRVLARSSPPSVCLAENLNGESKSNGSRSAENVNYRRYSDADVNRHREARCKPHRRFIARIEIGAACRIGMNPFSSLSPLVRLHKCKDRANTRRRILLKYIPSFVRSSRVDAECRSLAR